MLPDKDKVLVLTQQQPAPRVTNKNTAGARTCPACALAGAGGQRSPTDLFHAEPALIEAPPPTPTAGAGPDCECTQTFPAPVPGERAGAAPRRPLPQIPHCAQSPCPSVPSLAPQKPHKSLLPECPPLEAHRRNGTTWHTAA